MKNRFSDVMGEWVGERYSWRPTWAVGRGCGGRKGRGERGFERWWWGRRACARALEGGVRVATRVMRVRSARRTNGRAWRDDDDDDG